MVFPKIKSFFALKMCKHTHVQSQTDKHQPCFSALCFGHSQRKKVNVMNKHKLVRSRSLCTLFPFCSLQNQNLGQFPSAKPIQGKREAPSFLFISLSFFPSLSLRRFGSPAFAHKKTLERLLALAFGIAPAEGLWVMQFLRPVLVNPIPQGINLPNLSIYYCRTTGWDVGLEI